MERKAQKRNASMCVEKRMILELIFNGLPSAKECMKVRNADPRFGRLDTDFKILSKSAGVSQPGKGTFNDPAPREFFPFMGFDFFRNINA